MRSIADINVQEVFDYVKNIYQKTTKSQRIIFAVIVVSLVSGYLYGKSLWERYGILKRARYIVSEIAKSENDFFKKEGKYKKDIFTDTKLANTLQIGRISYDDFDFSEGPSSRRHRHNLNRNIEEDPNVAQSGDFYIEIDADNACMMLKYKRNTSDKTIFYASFENPKTLCQGKKCLKQSKNGQDNLCYADGNCFTVKLSQKTQLSCGNGNGTQVRTCEPSCEGGSCGKWSECICKKGFEWDGKTCKQSQTEKDCTEEQCFNGIYCEDKEPLVKNIENGSCQRTVTCAKNKGWKYTPWDCLCNSEDFCASNEQCVLRPNNQNKMTLPNQEGSCTNTYHICESGKGWIAKANNCECTKTGFFWDKEKGEAKCSPCTQKPEDAEFSSAGKDKDACAWKCAEGYQNRNGVCLKPNGQYLCARLGVEICTDDFSKKRKIIKDAQKTNERQLCFIEDKDNVLFYNKKEKSCILCQCVDLTTGKAFLN